jgi:hypothetical protein
MRDWEQFEKTAREESKAAPAQFRRRAYRRGLRACVVLIGVWTFLSTWPILVYFYFHLIPEVKSPWPATFGIVVVLTGFITSILYWVRFTRAISINFPAALPEGLNIPDDADTMVRKEVDEICSTLGATKIDKIIVSISVGSEVVAYKKYPVLGRPTWILRLGLYEMSMMTREEFHMALVYALSGHFDWDSGAKGRFNFAISSWGRLRELSEAVYAQRTAAGAPEPVLPWSRNTERELLLLRSVLYTQGVYDRDDIVARMLGKHEFACWTLKGWVANAVASRRFEKWNDEVERTQSYPPRDLVERAQGFYAQPPSADELETEMRNIRSQTSADTNPVSVPVRLARLGLNFEDCLPATDEVAKAPSKSALQEYFPNHYRAFEVYYSNRRRVNTREWFMENAFGRTRELARLEDLESQIEEDELLPAEYAALKLSLTAIVHGRVAALELVPAFLEKFPNEPFVMLEIGRLCLKEGREEGIDYLKRVIELHPRSANMATNAMLTYLDERDRVAERKEVYEAYQAVSKALLEPEKELDDFTSSTEFIPPKLSFHQRQVLADALRNAPWASRAWVATRNFKYAENKRVHYIAITPATGYASFAQRTDFSPLIQRDIFSNEELFFLRVYMMVPEWNRMYLRTKFAKLPNAQIFDRKTPFAFK